MCSAIQVSTNIGAGYDLCLSELCISAKILNKQNKTKQTSPIPSAFLLISFSSLQEKSHFALHSAETAALYGLLEVLPAANPPSVSLNVIWYEITEA